MPEQSATAPSRARWRAAFANVALVFGSLLAALGIGEIAIRIVAPQQLIMIRPDIWEPADTLGWVARANVNTTINTGERTVHVITDSLGMRVGRGEPRHKETGTNVLLVGDSFVEALQVEYPQTVGALLEERLTQQLGEPVTVWNAGVDGWDPPQYLVRTRQLLERQRFDLVIVALYLGNDIVPRRVDYRPARAPAERHHLRLPRGPSGPEIINALLYPINDFLEVRSQLFVFFRIRLRGILMRLGLSAIAVPAGISTRDSTSTMWDTTAAICSDIAKVGARHGIPVLFTLIPAPIAVDHSLAEESLRNLGLDTDSLDLGQPTRLTQRALEAQRLAVVPAEPFFESAYASGQRLYGTVDRHLTPAGHEVLARALGDTAAAVLSGHKSGPARWDVTSEFPSSEN